MYPGGRLGTEATWLQALPPAETHEAAVPPPLHAVFQRAHPDLVLTVFKNSDVLVFAAREPIVFRIGREDSIVQSLQSCDGTNPDIVRGVLKQKPRIVAGKALFCRQQICLAACLSAYAMQPSARHP